LETNTMRPAAMLCAVFAGVTAVLAQVPVTQPPEPIDPSPTNGETYYLINQLSGLQMDLNGSSWQASAYVTQSPRSFSSLSQRWAMTKLRDGNWKISNISSGLCLNSRPGFPEGNVAVVEDPCGVDVLTQEWFFNYTTNGYNVIRNAGARGALEASNPSAGARLSLSAPLGAPRQSQLWLFRPAYWRGNDMSTAVKEEYDRVAQNPNNLPWWHDAYLPGQDMLQIFKNSGMNAIRLRPASISTTVVHGNVSFSVSNGPYNNYTLPAGTSTTFPATAVNQVVPATTDGGSGNYAQTDWSAVDLAKRAKNLGMAVFLNLFYDGYNTADTPGLWKGMTVAQVAGVPPTPGLMYNYVKQEIELFRANGAMPDMVAIGNEANTGMFTSGLAPGGTSATPNAAGKPDASFANFAAIQIAAMQAIVDAAADPALGPPIPAPLRCIDTDGTPDLQTFFTTATQYYGIPVDNICESYYPGWHGPLTQAQFNWDDCGAGGDPGCNPAVGQHIEEANIDTEASGLEIPVFTAEDGVEYTPGGNPTDAWYGSALTPFDGSRAHERQFFIDLNKVEKSAPNNLGMGMDCWACEASPIPGAGGVWANGVYGYWVDAALGLFDFSYVAGSYLDNATLPSMLALGGKVDPTLTYKFVNAANGRILETAGPVFEAKRTSTVSLRTGLDTGVTALDQQWQILAQGGDAEQNDAVYPTPMDHLGDGYFQIVNMDQRRGIGVLDTSGDTTPGSSVVENPPTVAATATSGTNANQEWDIMSAGNCGDIPANCTAPPLTATGDYYMIVNKATGLVVATSGTGPDARIQQQAPAAASNGDWMVPASQGQLWQIFPVHIIATPPAFADSPVQNKPVISTGSF
jgi:arabinogalactan endo-1,4-beta-galactosidase